MKKMLFFCLFVTGIFIFPMLSPAQEAKDQSDAAKSEETELGEWWLRNPLTYEKLPEQFLYHVEAGYDWNRDTGNQIADNHSLSGLLTLRKKIFTYSIRYTFDKQHSAKRAEPPKQDSNVTLRESIKHEIHNDIRVALTNRLIFSPGMFFLKDDYAQIKNRYTYYAGLGYTLLNMPRLLVNTFGAYGYEEMNYIGDYHEVYLLLKEWERKVEDYDPGTKRSRIIYLYQDFRFYLTRSVALNESFRHFSTINDGDKYRWNLSVGLEMMLTQHVLASFGYTEDYDNAPESIMGLRKRDNSVTSGIILSF